tara:strand:+ start:521 stop:805 length:285 start_codon:yes stop_codon:yes gene_type:complete
MEINFDDKKEFENPLLEEPVDKESKLKELIVDFVGEYQNPENGDVTTEMIIEVFAKEFPEFLMAVAEENWVRGYHQALEDIEIGEKIAQEKNSE